ncbi:hypothetical protein M6B38_240255 [Iris pallida]|uniref:Uncharacterized protein n=1 Tax=Iris pallida TaxID=29817 RepID=A0AAX6DKA3_IRIPA|nr:hypothetical protein M6B38_240255 [Iris pallida]
MAGGQATSSPRLEDHPLNDVQVQIDLLGEHGQRLLHRRRLCVVHLGVLSSRRSTTTIFGDDVSSSSTGDDCAWFTSASGNCCPATRSIILLTVTAEDSRSSLAAISHGGDSSPSPVISVSGDSKNSPTIVRLSFRHTTVISSSSFDRMTPAIASSSTIPVSLLSNFHDDERIE